VKGEVSLPIWHLPSLPFSRSFPKSKNLQEDVTKNFASVILETKGIGSLDSLLSQNNKWVAGPKVPFLTLPEYLLAQFFFIIYVLFFFIFIKALFGTNIGKHFIANFYKHSNISLFFNFRKRR